MLIILGGLPGVGKSTIAKRLAEKLQAVHVRIDSIEQAIKDAAQYCDDGIGINVVAEGYVVAYAIAKDNLAIGLTVIADSVNPIELTRGQYRAVAEQANACFLEVEIICSDQAVHQERVETRESTVAGLKLPSWEEVLNREYEPWGNTAATIDTAKCSVEEAVQQILDKI